MTTEYLSVGGPARPRLPRWVSVLVIVLVLLACAGAWAADRVKSNANDALSSALASTQDEAASGQAEVLSTLAYAYPMIWSSLVTEDVRTSLREVVQRSASRVVTTLESQRGQVAGTLILPWQASQADARDAVLAVLDQHIDRFERIASDASAIGSVMAEPAPSDRAAVDLLRASGATVAGDR